MTFASIRKSHQLWSIVRDQSVARHAYRGGFFLEVLDQAHKGKLCTKKTRHKIEQDSIQYTNASSFWSWPAYLSSTIRSRLTMFFSPSIPLRRNRIDSPIHSLTQSLAFSTAAAAASSPACPPLPLSLHPASSATISAHLSAIPNTVTIGLIVVISGNTPASATRHAFSPRNRRSGPTHAIGSVARLPIFVVPAGW